jgi:CAAX protease family protein
LQDPVGRLRYGSSLVRRWHLSKAEVMITIGALRPTTDRALWRLWGYLLLIAAAELFTSVVNLYLGLVIHATLLVIFIVRGGIGRVNIERRLTLALALAPLIRLLSLTLPLSIFPQLAWYPIVSVPLLVATWIIIRQLRLSRSDLGLGGTALPLQLMLVGGGLGLGAIEYYILIPGPLVAVPTWQTVLLSSLTLFVFTGLTEELIFRGLIQTAALPILGRWALVYVSLLFAVLHIGYLSVVDVVFVFMVGMIFAYIVRWSGTILGVTLAHGMTNTTLFLIMPVVAQQPSRTSAAIWAWAIWGGSLMAIVAIVVLAARKLTYPGMAASVRALGADIRSACRDIGTSLRAITRQPDLPIRWFTAVTRELRTALIQLLVVRSDERSVARDSPLRRWRRQIARSIPGDTGAAQRLVLISGLNVEGDSNQSRELPPTKQASSQDDSQSLPQQKPDIQHRGSHAWLQPKSQGSHRLFWKEAGGRGVRHSFRLEITLAISCAAVLMSLGSMWLLSPQTSANHKLNASAPTSALQQTPQSQALQAPSAARVLMPSTATAPGVSPNHSNLAPTLSQSPAVTVRQQAGGAAMSAPTSQAFASPLPSSPASQVSAPTAEGSMPTNSLPAARAILQQVAASVAMLRTGQIEAMLDYGGGTNTSAQLSFDLGGQQSVPRFHIVTSYTGSEKAYITELVVIGDKAWQRQSNAPWRAAVAQAGAWDQVQIFLPSVDSTANLEVEHAPNIMTLRWYDATRDADVTLQVDPATGAPRKLRQVSRATGLALAVIYREWNTPVEITLPDAN